jgi:hypothetical protein
MNPDARHRLNVAGPFYVLEGQCIACGAPEHEAPALMSNEESHCYFRRQPITAEETNRAIWALWASCCGAVRYGGQDPEVLRRLAELGEAERCDHPPPGNLVSVQRNLATFHFQGSKDLDPAEEILDLLRDALLGQGERHRCQRLPTIDQKRGLSWTWYEGAGVEIRVQPEPGRLGRWLLRLSRVEEVALHGAAMAIDDILKADARIRGVRWYTARDWEEDRGRWTELPY